MSLRNQLFKFKSGFLISGAAFLNWNFGKNNCIALLAKVFVPIENMYFDIPKLANQKY